MDEGEDGDFSDDELNYVAGKNMTQAHKLSKPANPKTSTTKSLVCLKHALKDPQQPCEFANNPGQCKWSHDPKLCRDYRNVIRRNLLQSEQQDTTHGALYAVAQCSSPTPSSAMEEKQEETKPN